MDNKNNDYATPVIRTDFTDEAAWKMIQRDVTATNIMGFSANVRFIDDKQYSVGQLPTPPPITRAIG